MISKIRKYQDSWLTKSILALTALSFMSLFGITGYVTSAGKNRAVIKVDNLEILQDEMNIKLQNNIRKAQNMFGESFELDDEARKNILASLVKEDAANMIIARQAQKNNVSISDDLIKKIIASQPEFMDNSGHFNPELLRRQLSFFDMSEQEYIQNLKQNILRRHLVSSAVEHITFPQFMNNYISQIENQQKIFNYVTVDPSKLKTDRDISAEEIEQYYQDFAPQFEEPENRDVSFIELKIADLSKNIEISDDEINNYYDSNRSEYVVPEKRNILQMVFDSEENANQALNKLNSGADFYQIASDMANQDKETTQLGNVTADSLLPEISDDVFDAPKGKIVGPINSEFGWHILKVVQITPKKETPLASVKSSIISTLRQEQSYDKALDIISDIEDKIGSGADMASIAKEYNAKLNQVKALTEKGTYKSISSQRFADVITTSDFVDVAFSYNEGEVTQTIETDNSFILASVDKINEAHIKDIDIVKPEIIRLWAQNEKSAIAQEIINDVIADLDNGDNLRDIASRFGLKLYTTAPLKRGTAFANLTTTQLNEAYQTGVGEYRTLTNEGSTTIVVPLKVITPTASTNKQQLANINSKMQKSIEQNLENELVEAYAKDMDVRIKYRLLGLED